MDTDHSCQSSCRQQPVSAALVRLALRQAVLRRLVLAAQQLMVCTPASAVVDAVVVLVVHEK
jgi:hypothetical protein